jgi:glycosyltransferase involved in cell wall biosynthesis
MISVVVPVRNGQRTIEPCLASILATEYPPYAREVIVVDNGSTDLTPALIERYPVRRLREAERGPGPARNRGILASRGEIIAFTDADCVVARTWLRELAATFDTDEVWAVAGEVAAYPPETPTQRYVAMRRPWHQRAALLAERPYFVTMNVAFRRRTFDRVGLFDARFLTGQDQDFAWRYFASGLTVRYAPRALVLHQHRRNAWEFFRQQLGWAYGKAHLHRRHGLRWGLDDEWREVRKLARAMRMLVAALSRRAIGGRDDVQYPFHSVVRELAWRAGMAHGRIRARRAGDAPRTSRRTVAGRPGPARAVILTYHAIAPATTDPHGLCVTPEHLAEHLEVVRRTFEPLRLADLVEPGREGNPRRCGVVLTFDDGYANNLHAAKPLLERFEVPATVFVMGAAVDAPTEFWWDELERLLLTPGFVPRVELTVRGLHHEWACDGERPYTAAEARRHRRWRMRDEHDPSPRHRLYRSLYELLQPLSAEEQGAALAALRSALGVSPVPRPERRPLTSAELVELVANGHLEVGAHTATHPVLSLRSSRQQRDEIRQAKAQLEAAVRRPVTLFAYPYGTRRHYSSETVALVRQAGFLGACTTVEGVVRPASDPWQLPRVIVRDWDGRTLLAQLDCVLSGNHGHS